MSTATTLSRDAEAILLLCGHFSGSSDQLKPLTIKEYDRVVRWLASNALKPGDLLEAFDSINQIEDSDLDWARIGRLLDRGPALALAVERWFNHGLWILTRADKDYPPRILASLRNTSPPILYGIGDRRLLSGQGQALAIVGSRNVDETGIAFAKRVASNAANDNITVVSGGARGVDMTAMDAALSDGGAAVGVLANNLNRAAVNAEFRAWIRDERLTLISPFTPEAGFQVGNAMARNKLIYTLADWALVVASEARKGGTWAGATENLERPWRRPLFIRSGPAVPEGNLELIAKGGLAFDPSVLEAERPLSGLLNGIIAEATTTTDAPAAGSEPVPGEPSLPEDPIFDAVWPLIEAELATPRKLRDLRDQLGPTTKQVQLKAWLDEAMRRGLVERPGRPAIYQLTDRSDPDGPRQLPIFDK